MENVLRVLDVHQFNYECSRITTKKVLLILSVLFFNPTRYYIVIVQRNLNPMYWIHLRDAGWKTQLLQTECLSFFSPIKILKANLSLNITSKQLKVLSITKLHKLFKCSQSIRVYDYAFSAQSRILMRTNVGNNVNSCCSLVA